MKKAISLLLSLLMVLSLAACGSQTDSVGKIDEDKQQTEQTDSIQQTEQVDSTQQTETDAPEESTPAFDNSWASNEFEHQIPEPPFANWFVVETENENEYLIYAEDVLYTDAKEYGELLAACAFTKNPNIDDAQDGMWYSLYAANGAGFMLNYVFGAYSYDEPKTGSVEISIFDDRANSAPQGSATSSSWGDAEIDALVPGLPEAEWDGDASEKPYGKEYRLSCYSLTKEEVMAYVDVLKKSGFDNDMDEEPNGYLYRFEGSNTNNKVTVQIRIDATANAEVLLTEAFATINK